MQSLWLIRHAARLDFIQPEWFTTAIHPYDPPLSPAGIEQSQLLAHKFSGEPIDAIFTSPFLRTIQTAAPIAHLLQLSIQLEWGLCEWLCQEWTSSFPETLTIAQLISEYSDIDPTYQSLVVPYYPETHAELDARCSIIADRLVRDKINEHNNTIAIGHKISILGIAKALTGDKSWGSYDLACGDGIKLTRSGSRWHSEIVDG